MALTPNFSASQASGTPSIITLTDSSSGSDVSVTQRRAFLLQSDGTYLVPNGTTTNYIQWAIGNTSINIDVLTQDTALSITVQWLDVSNNVLYSKTIAFGFTAYNETFYYSLTQNQVPINTPSVILNTGYFKSKMILRVCIDSGNQAISFASDIQTAQQSYNNATYLRTNENLFF
jgi:hypothetical protein